MKHIFLIHVSLKYSIRNGLALKFQGKDMVNSSTSVKILTLHLAKIRIFAKPQIKQIIIMTVYLEIQIVQH